VWASFTRFAGRVPVVFWAAIGAGIVGCQWGPADGHVGPLPILGQQAETVPAEPAEPGPQAEPDAVVGRSGVLGRDGWIRTTRSHRDAAAHVEPTRRWRFPDLEDLLTRPPHQRPDFRRLVTDDDPIVATNAAICLARLGDSSGMEQLAEGVRDPDLKLRMRLAAAEALGTVAEPSPVGLLRELVDQYGRHDSNEAAGYIPELHAQLVRSLARHVDPVDDPRLVEALRSPASEVRLAAIRAWAGGRRGGLPVEAVDLRTDPDPRVRIAVMAALARRHHPDAHRHLAAALSDHNLRVRIAAIDALGELGGAEARATLEGLLEDEGELIRAAAVSALAAVDAAGGVMAAAGDESWRVRSEVARALVRYPDRKGATLARRLLDDPSSAVQLDVVEAAARWPLGRAGPVLLEAMGKASYMTRRAAAERLAELWPPAAEFPVDGPPQRRVEVLRRLYARFGREIGLVDREALAGGASPLKEAAVSPETVARVEQLLGQLSDPGLPPAVRRQAVRALSDFGPELTAALERLAVVGHRALPEPVYHEVLPRHSAVFGALDRMTSDDVSIRRRAAGELEQLAGERPLGRLAVARLATVAVTEPDPLVWQSLLRAVADDPSEPSIRLAYAAIGHPSPEVRRRACEHLATHADAKHAPVLLPALEDENVLVQSAAARALGAGGRLDDTEPLRRLLTAANEPLRVDVAVALCRLGDPSGAAALERLARSNDQRVRLQVAAVMGQLGDPSFVPTLIRMLDDRQGIRRAALQSLPKVVGRDVAGGGGERPRHSAERIAAWKQWFKDRGKTVGIRERPLMR